MTKASQKPLDPKLLRHCCNPDHFSFNTTDELADLDRFVGQERALTATRFGIDIKRDGFNIFALGPTGFGKRSIVLSLLEKEAKKKPPPPDLCYINNFKDPRVPKVMLLPAGLGKKLAEDMRQMVEILRVSIPAIFDSEAYTNRIKEIQKEGRTKQEHAFEALEKDAEKKGVAVVRTPDGFMLAISKDGKVLSEEEFDALTEAQRAENEALMGDFHDRLQTLLEKIPQWQKESREKIREAVKNFTLLQVGSTLNELRTKYADQKDIVRFLHDVEQAILDNPNDFKKAKDGAGAIMPGDNDSIFNRYLVNVLVDNSVNFGAPIVHEDLPIFANLVGRIDHASRFGALSTDFTLIRPGALQRAHGGYLLLDAIRLLTQPHAWEGLKRCLRSKEVRVENFHQVLGYVSTTTIEPEPMPLDVKVVLFGDREIYYLLCATDHEFPELFKVAADFDEEIAVTEESSFLFAQLLKTLSKKHSMRALTNYAVIAVHEYAVRLAGDRNKVSTHVSKLTDLIREADHYASVANEPLIREADVEEAMAQQIYRASRVRDRHHESIARGNVLLNFSGDHVGQINGLSYYEIGGFAFGQPVRITARVGLGTGRIVDIEREVNLGGPIHSKGVLILTGYINGQFARNDVISLSASLVFEQSYGGVEGDSATAAEALALLSAIAEVPLKQGIGITGSMNQHGDIQPIGGVNEKIEGFFALCKTQGLTGEQGVIIPHANIDNLMLNKEVIDAVRKKQFHVYAVKTIDEAIIILTGHTAGARDSHGHFPRDSINGKVEAALKSFARRAKTSKRSNEATTK